MTNNGKNISIFFGGITKIVPDGSVSTQEIIDQIKNPTYKILCNNIKNIKDDDLKSLKKKRNQIKKSLAYVTPAGIFSERKKSCIQKQSGFCPIDIDYIDITKYHELLKKDPYIHVMFISPSGEGLKLFVKIPLGLETYSKRVISFYEYINKKYKINIESLDNSTHDISRACYLSYDPNIYHNENSLEFTDIYEDSQIFKKDYTRSAKEYKIIIRLLFAGHSKSHIYDHMKTYSKWNDASEAYREHTFKKALKYVEETLKLTTDEKRSIIPEIARKCMDDHAIVSIRTDKNTEMWIYRDGIFVPDAKTYIEEFTGNILGDFYDTMIVNKIIDFIKKDTYMSAQAFFEDEDPQYICVQNGILNVLNKKLYDFTSKKRFFNKLPVVFDPSQDCKFTKKHFDTVLKKEDIPLMQELYGYILYRDYNIQKAFLFGGDGGNGKGKTIDQMKCLIGNENVVNISLQTFEKEPFMKSQVHKKLANLGADLGKSELADTSTFRALTGEDLITANRKFLDSISFRNYAKMIFAVNTLPHISDDTEGFWRRWINIDFAVSFLPKNIYDEHKKNNQLKPYHRVADIHISKNLTNEDELSGVLNWALDGLKRLMDNKDFSYYKSSMETKEKMQKRESSAIIFVQECLEITSNLEQYEVQEDMYRAYINFCMKSNSALKIESEFKFKRILENHGLSMQMKRIATGRQYRWYFVKIKRDDKNGKI